MTLDSVGTAFIGTDSANANMTIGLTINQAANDDQIMAFKSSDVGHSFTTDPGYELDTFGSFSKTQSTSGGLRISGVKDNHGDPRGALALEGLLDEAADTTDTSSGRGVIEINASITDSSNGRAAVADAGNAVVIQTQYLTRLLVKGDGDLHITNTTLVALDDQPDALVVRAMQRESASSGIIESEYDNPFYDGAWLRERGLLGEGVDPLYSVQKTAHTHAGAIWQNYTNHMSLAEKVDGLEMELIAAKKQLAAISA
jgi:hypothetical protein